MVHILRRRITEIESIQYESAEMMIVREPSRWGHIIQHSLHRFPFAWALRGYKMTDKCNSRTNLYTAIPHIPVQSTRMITTPSYLRLKNHSKDPISKIEKKNGNCNYRKRQPWMAILPSSFDVDAWSFRFLVFTLLIVYFTVFTHSTIFQNSQTHRYGA